MSEAGRFYPGAHVVTAGERAALVIAGSGASIDYPTLHATAIRMARALRSLGLDPGDHVSLCCENRLDYPALWWGAHYAGTHYTLISTQLTAAEIAYILTDSGAKALVLSAAQAKRLGDDLAERTPAVRMLVTGGSHPQAAPLEPLLTAQSSEPLEDAVEGHAMLYSSGTSGAPKAIKRPMTGNPLGTSPMFVLLAQGIFGLSADSVYLSPAPLYHAAPYGFVTAATALGATAVIMESFDAEQVLANIEHHRVTHAQFVPTMFIRLLELSESVRAKYDLSSLRCAIHAAAPCPILVKDRMLEWWGPVIHEYYSGTEGAGFTHCGPQDWLAHKGSVGRPLMGEIHVVDDDGRELPSGEEGLIYFGGGMPFEYHNDPAKTEEAHLRGWATLGDVGRVDENGFLYLTDRKSSMIITGGVNVYPQETENLLAAHPAVFDVAVIGIPHPTFGEEVKAVVQPASGFDASPELETDLIAFCHTHLAPVKCPRSVDFCESLPRHATGKLLKRLLRDEYWHKHNSRI